MADHNDLLHVGVQQDDYQKFSSERYPYTEDNCKLVQDDIQEKIREVIWKKLVPAILEYMKTFHDLKLQGIAIEHIPFEFLCSYRGSLKPAFSGKEQCNLYLMKEYLYVREDQFCNIDGKILVGAAIRTSNFIGKQEYADELKEIVKDCFIPDEHPDPNVLVPSYCY